MYEIGARIKAFREQKGYSQKEFAQHIGAKNTTVSNWEKGLTRPDADTIGLICNTLEISADELLDIHLSELNLTNKERRIITQYRLKPEMHPAIDIILDVRDFE